MSKPLSSGPGCLVFRRARPGWRSGWRGGWARRLFPIGSTPARTETGTQIVTDSSCVPVSALRPRFCASGLAEDSEPRTAPRRLASLAAEATGSAKLAVGSTREGEVRSEAT